MAIAKYQKSYQLPKLLQPYRDEGPRGYLLRLAEANLSDTYQLSQIGIGYNVEQLSAHGLLTEPIVDAELIHQIQQIDEWLHSGKPIFNEKFSRFCPHCLSESHYWRLEWELLFYDACHHHGVWLVDQCNSCNKKIDWKRSQLNRCACGADLTMEGQSLREAPESLIKLSRAISQKSLLHQNKAPLSAPVELTDLEQTQRLIRYLGNYANQASGRNPLKMHHAGDINQSWPVTTLAAELLDHWPKSFHESLTNLEKKNRSKDGRPSLNNVFGQAYHYVFESLTEPAFKEVKAQFERWISEAWKGGIAGRNKRLLPVLLKNAAWIPSNAACDFLGVSIQRLQMLIREGAIEGETHISAKGRKFIMVRRDNLEETKNQLLGMINMHTAHQLLGIQKRRMRLLLRFLFKDARKLGPAWGSPWEVSRQEVNKILDVNNQLNEISIPDEDCVSMGHIMKYWTMTNQDIANLIFAVVKTEIIPVNRLDTETGISAWVFKENEVKLWKSKFQVGLTNWMTIDKAAKLLEIKQQVAYQLVKINLLKAEVMPEQKKQGTRVNRKSIEAFQEKYIFSTKIAERLGCSSQKVIKDLAFMGVKPVSGPSVDGMRQMLFLRREVLANLTLEK